MNIQDLFFKLLEQKIKTKYYQIYGDKGKFLELLYKQNGEYGKNLSLEELELFKKLKLIKFDKQYVMSYEDFITNELTNLIEHYDIYHYNTTV